MQDSTETWPRVAAAIGRYDAYFFDLDGTVYLGGRRLPGVDRLLDWLAGNAIPYAFLTNNPTSTVEAYEERLERLGIAARGRVDTSAVATASWLRDNHPAARVHAIAEPPLEQTLRAVGVTLSSDPAEIDIVVSSFDRTFTYAKLDIAFQAIVGEDGAMLVATNPDGYCPAEGRVGEPDAAATTAAIEASTGDKCAHVFGKPSPALARIAAGPVGVEPARAIMVGDRLYPGIAMAIRAGMDSALVMTGDAVADDVEQAPPSQRPTFCLERIDSLIPAEDGGA